MRLRHIILASAALLSASALAEGTKATAPDRQAQSSAAMQAQHDPAVIRQAQQKLSAAGYDIGAADGKWGGKTQQALKDFQKAKGIEVTGELDQRTLSALGVRVGATSGSAAEATVGASQQRPREPAREPAKSKPY